MYGGPLSLLISSGPVRGIRLEGLAVCLRGRDWSVVPRVSAGRESCARIPVPGKGGDPH